MAASSQEIQPRHQEDRPTFIETIDRTHRVGILEDGTWSVGWKQSGGQVVWHRHEDVWRVFRQNERVMQRFLGIPLNAEEVEESKNDPDISMSLPNLKGTLFILGETQKAQELSGDITTIMSLSVNRRTPAQIITRELTRVRDKFSPNVKRTQSTGKAKVVGSIKLNKYC